jgi:hypothetical protein
MVASSSFTINAWDEQPFLDEDGARIYRTLLSKRFEGDLEARSVGDMTMTTSVVSRSPTVGSST